MTRAKRNGLGRWRQFARFIAPIAVFSILIAHGAVVAQEAKQDAKKKDTEKKPNEGLLTFERVFASGEFAGGHGAGVRWHAKRGGYIEWERSPDGGGRDLIWRDVASEKTQVLVPALRFVPPFDDSPLSVESYQFSDDESKLLIYTNSVRVWRQRTRGDYWVLDIAAGELKKLGGDARPSTLGFAKFSPDGSRVAYVRDNNIYVEDLRGGGITALTEDGSANIINGTFDWVNEEELDLRDGFRWSPDGSQIAYWQVNTEGVREFPLINNTRGLYPEVKTFAYPKAGERNSAVRVGIVNADGGGAQWLDLPGDPREHYIAHMDWAAGDDNKGKVVVQQFNRLQNQNTLMLADTEGNVRTVMKETDKAWVENSNHGFDWLEGGKKLLWLSERDGWRQAYAVSMENGEARRITAGGFDVIGIEGVDEDGGWLYYSASPENATEKYLFRVKLDGSKTERITPDAKQGTHDYSISPDAKHAVHTFSSFETPPMSEIVSLPDHKQVKPLSDSEALIKKLATIKKAPAEFFKVDIGHGVLLDGWCIKPPKLKKKQRYPLLFYVYGEPAGQTVVNRYMGRNYLWYLMLAQQGYVVMSIDNRGTPAPKGREWRKSIYRQVGILASEDQAKATRALLNERAYLDPERIAIWGWSGGGSMTLNALFRYPDLYRTGMAVASVPNQRLYDSIYQERYMGLPGDNAEGYFKGSSINYAYQLKGNLLLVHGTGDDNVHYQGAEALVNELVAHDKPFTMFAYPNRSHSISEGRNTSRHLFAMLTKYLNDTVPAGPRKVKTEKKSD
jgi:dipeptidyl-peptidase-4